MKFRSKMTELVSIRMFAQLVHTLQKCSKSYVIRLLPDKLLFVLSERDSSAQSSSVSGATAWCEVPQDTYFSEYMMEGIAPQDNEIYLEVCADKIASSLSSLKNSHNVNSLKIKLTKKLVPCLTFEIELQGLNSNPTCTHDIPVTIITRRHWNEFQQPELPTFDICLQMPELKILRLAFDRMKNLGRILIVKASNAGKLTLAVDTYNVKCNVNFCDLHTYETGEMNQGGVGVRATPMTPLEGASSEKEFIVEVDMKCVQHLIPAEATKPTNFICSLAEDRLLHLYFSYGDITLQYSVPVVSSHAH